MILTRVLRDILRNKGVSVPETANHDAVHGPRVLNVGGGSKQIPIPVHYSGWEHLLLDISPEGAPDIVCDARELQTLQGEQFDAVYCSHNLEHYYKHHGARVLAGFLHVLRPDGFAEIRVPDLRSVMKRVVESGLDVEDTLYLSPAGPITVRDILYGLGSQIEKSGVDFYAHKTGFSASSLAAFLDSAGFARIFVNEREELFEVHALAFKQEPTDSQRALLGL